MVMKREEHRRNMYAMHNSQAVVKGVIAPLPTSYAACCPR
jgi:hypothetical protein